MTTSPGKLLPAGELGKYEGGLQLAGIAATTASTGRLRAHAATSLELAQGVLASHVLVFCAYPTCSGMDMFGEPAHSDMLEVQPK